MIKLIKKTNSFKIHKKCFLYILSLNYYGLKAKWIVEQDSNTAYLVFNADSVTLLTQVLDGFSHFVNHFQGKFSSFSWTIHKNKIQVGCVL